MTDLSTLIMTTDWDSMPDGAVLSLPEKGGALDRLAKSLRAKIGPSTQKITTKKPKLTLMPKTPKVYDKVTLKAQARDRLIVRAIRAAQESGIPVSDPYSVYKGFSLLTKHSKEQYLHITDELNYLPSLKATNWERTSDHLKQVYYNLALCQSPDIIAFTLNLSRERSEEARKTGAAKHLQERLARQFKRSLTSYEPHLPFWFSIEINSNGILHLHGAMPQGTNSKDKIRSALEVAGGPYSDSDSTRPVSLPNAYDPHGWLVYSLKDSSWIPDRIGTTFACTRSIQITAKKLYNRDRKLINNMRS